MDRNILKVKPMNLPVYVYRLQATIAIVYKDLAFKVTAYDFYPIVIRANQALRPGDVLFNDCCYYGNEYIEIIPHLCEKQVLGGLEKELKYYYGCQINEMAISYVDDKSISASCGVGKCTVFIGLPATHKLDYWKNLVSDWDLRLEYIGEAPKNLMY